jgi:hypothetical protein
MPIIKNDAISDIDKLKPATLEYFWKTVRKVFGIASDNSDADMRIKNTYAEDDANKDKIINVDYVLTQATKINKLENITININGTNYTPWYNKQADLRMGPDETYTTDKVATVEYVRRVINCINSCSRSCTSCTNGCSSCASLCTNGCSACTGCKNWCTNVCTSCTSCTGGCDGCSGGPCNCDCPCQGPCNPCNSGGSGSGPCGCPACGTSFFYDY